MGVKLSGNTAKGRKEVYTGFRDRFDKILEGCKVIFASHSSELLLT
jgi:hypothetical protein